MLSATEDLERWLTSGISEAKGLLVLRRCGGSQEERARWSAELSRLSVRVSQVESEAEGLMAALAREREVMETAAKQIRAMLVVQQEDIRALNAALPQHMKPKRQTSAETPHPQNPQQQQRTMEMTANVQHQNTTEPGQQQQQQPMPMPTASSTQPPAKKKAKKGAIDVTPATRVTLAELDGVPSYMRGRLTAERCNEALDEIQRLIEARYARMKQASRSASESEASRAENDRALEALAEQQHSGLPFMSEADVADSTIVRLDTAGRMLIGTLRHLQRIKEASIRGTKTWSLVKHI